MCIRDSSSYTQILRKLSVFQISYSNIKHCFRLTGMPQKINKQIFGFTNDNNIQVTLSGSRADSEYDSFHTKRTVCFITVIAKLLYINV